MSVDVVVPIFTWPTSIYVLPCTTSLDVLTCTTSLEVLQTIHINTNFSHRLLQLNKNLAKLCSMDYNSLKMFSIILSSAARCQGTVPVWPHLPPPQLAGERLLWHQICGPGQTEGKPGLSFSCSGMGRRKFWIKASTKWLNIGVIDLQCIIWIVIETEWTCSYVIAVLSSSLNRFGVI